MAAQRNKADANDALGIPHIMRTGWFKSAHVKRESSYAAAVDLAPQRQAQVRDIEKSIRHSLKLFGQRFERVGLGGFERAVRKAVKGHPLTEGPIDCAPGAGGAAGGISHP